MTIDVQQYLKSCSLQINDSLEARLPSESIRPCELHKAMRYSVLNGGKRLRCAFIYAFGEAFGAKKEVLTEIAMVIEIIHAFSLIHDDLPALDNDDLRRGKPTCHKVFGEATAILAGDALHSLAFEILVNLPLPATLILKMVSLVAHAVGSQGMIGGETLDISMVNTQVTVEEVEYMYTLKTSSLLSAGMILAVLAAESMDSDILYNTAKFGENLGIAFQIHDDIIGIESDTETLGKRQSADLAANKPVYPILVGMIKAKSRRDALLNMAKENLSKLPVNTKLLSGLAEFIIIRKS